MHLADERQLNKNKIVIVFRMTDEIQIANILSDKNAMLVLTYMSYMNASE